MKTKINDKSFLIIAIICVIIFCLFYFIEQTRKNDKPTVIISATDSENDGENTAWRNSDKPGETALCVVHVDGAVVNPGVYELEENMRINDAVTAAGGLTEDADTYKINLAGFIEDGQKIYIPSASAQRSEDTDDGIKLIDINTAGIETLKSLPGVGDVTAGNIIAYRETNGSFASIEDIQNVPRIGDKTFEQIKPYITVQ